MIPAPESRRLADWLRWQETLNPRTIELGLERVRTVAARLDLVRAHACTLTVGGTNGKGSSATLAAQVWQQAGYRVGLYTSPHVLRYEERVQIDGRDADEAMLCRAFLAIERVRSDVPLTYFEFGTLAALWCFREARVDAQVLEVGLGGRLDAVNLVDADAALLTNVGLDHQDWLGPDRESIGTEKAGIFRRGRPAVVVERDPPRSVLSRAAALGADLRRLGVDYDYRVADGGAHWTLSLPSRRIENLPPPGQPGLIQFQNASGVLAAIDALQARLPTPERAIRAALPRLKVPARLERRGQVLLDVAHNVEAATVLAAHLRALAPPRAVLVLGMLADKPVAEVAAVLAPQVAGGYAVALGGPRGLSAAQLVARAGEGGLALQACDNMATALIRAREQAGPDGFVVVTGSFLTIAEADPLLHG